MKLVTLGALLACVGAGVFALTFFRLVNGGAIEAQSRAPGALTSEADEPGRYYLWDNHWTVFEGERLKYPSDCPSDPDVTVVDAEGGELEFVADASQNWTIGNHEKTSIGYIDVESGTTLRIEVGDLGRERIVSVSNLTEMEELWERLSGFAIGLAVAVVGLPIAGVGWLIRRRPAKQ